MEPWIVENIKNDFMIPRNLLPRGSAGDLPGEDVVCLGSCEASGSPGVGQSDCVCGRVSDLNIHCNTYDTEPVPLFT